MLVSLLLFLLAFGALLTLERFVHRRLQEFWLVLTGHSEAATLFYSLVLLPGVALHEVSHALMAILLGVKVRKLSLRPERQKGGVIRLGYVEVLRSDTVRTSLIGAAPLFAGAAALIFIGLQVFDLQAMQDALSTGNTNGVIDSIKAITVATDAWIWIYLVFAIANSMMPSTSDTQAWPPVIGFLAVVGALALLLGGTDLLRTISPLAQYVLRWLTAAFIVTLVIDVGVIAVLSAINPLLMRATNRRIEFK
jgi:hypothetical protein